MKRFIKKWIIRLMGILNKHKNTVLFESFGGKQYSDNPRAISETLHEKRPEIVIVWLLNNVKGSSPYFDIIPDYIKIVRPRTYAYFKALATSKCFVTNESGIMPTMHKRKDQYFITTWHGDRGFKRVKYDKKEMSQYKVRDKKYQLTDLYITASDYGIKRCRESFLYDGEIMCEGMPRNDVLVSQTQEKIERIKGILSVSTDCKILLFAPTFRGTNQKQKIEVDLNAVLSRLNEKGESWICLIRSHSLSAGFSGVVNNYVVDVSTYPDMADLLLISDMLITDYSSSSGDFILRNKPVILAHYDIEEYQNKYRDLRFSPKEAGYFCVYNNEELLNLIGKMTEEMAIEECERLKAFYGVHETGKSAELVCQRIAEFIDKSNKN